jgi:hypothetical protein
MRLFLPSITCYLLFLLHLLLFLKCSSGGGLFLLFSSSPPPPPLQHNAASKNELKSHSQSAAAANSLAKFMRRTGRQTQIQTQQYLFHNFRRRLKQHERHQQLARPTLAYLFAASFSAFFLEYSPLLLFAGLTAAQVSCRLTTEGIFLSVLRKRESESY